VEVLVAPSPVRLLQKGQRSVIVDSKIKSARYVGQEINHAGGFAISEEADVRTLSR
jgi:hypothetical protein